MLFLAGKSVYNERQSLWSKSCFNNEYLLGCLTFVWQKCVDLSLIYCGKCVCSLVGYCIWWITGLHQNLIWQKCISLYANFCLNAKVYNSMLFTAKLQLATSCNLSALSVCLSIRRKFVDN